MVDIVDARTRSQMMSNIRGKDTKPELALRKALHAPALCISCCRKNLGWPDFGQPYPR